MAITNLATKQPFFLNAGPKLIPTVESGTWLPAVIGTTGFPANQGVQTYTDRAGTWTRIGNRLFGDFRANMLTKDGATSNAIAISIAAIPFRFADTLTNTGLRIGVYQNIDLTAFIQLSGICVAGASYILLIKNALNGGVSTVAAAEISNTFLLTGQFSCIINPVN